ncbi:transposable element Tcb2 transposase [Trichonephila clavipes]|nr:transposable element Tcb2 transposase [Trichonephila clavipes]
MQRLPGAIFQQDNAQPHMARVSQDCLHTVTTLPWPARSPDLSPIEYIWDHLERYRIVACLVTSSSPVPLKACRVEGLMSVNLYRSSKFYRCGVEIRRRGLQLKDKFDITIAPELLDFLRKFLSWNRGGWGVPVVKPEKFRSGESCSCRCRSPLHVLLRSQGPYIPSHTQACRIVSSDEGKEASQEALRASCASRSYANVVQGVYFEDVCASVLFRQDLTAAGSYDNKCIEVSSWRESAPRKNGRSTSGVYFPGRTTQDVKAIPLCSAKCIAGTRQSLCYGHNRTVRNIWGVLSGDVQSQQILPASQAFSFLSFSSSTISYPESY